MTDSGTNTSSRKLSLGLGVGFCRPSKNH